MQAVRAFCGETIVHVGEWRGDTGDHHFESELAANWELQTRLPLPNWGDTAEDLTVWKRRKSSAAAAAAVLKPAVHPILTCDAAGRRH